MKKKKKKTISTPKKGKRKATAVPKKQTRKPTGTLKTGKGKSTGAAKKGKGKRGPALTTYSPDICVSNFTGSNNGTVEFQNIPAAGVTISQISGYVYPFSPVTGTNNGLKYTDVASGGSVTIVVAAINQTYYYDVSCPCPGLEGTHSVTVNS